MEENNNSVNTDKNVSQEVSPIEGETKEVPVQAAGVSDEPSSNKNLIIGIVVAALALGGGYWWYNQSVESSSSPTVESTEIDPEAVVATVNGEEILGSALIFQMTQSAELAGLPSLDVADAATLELLKSQSIDSVVNTALLIQTAKSLGVEVETAEVDAEYDILVAGVGGEEAANSRLSSLGVTVDDFKVTLTNDIYIRKYLEATTDETALEVTDIEVENFYASVSGGGEDIPPLEDVRLQIEEQLRFQKQQEIVVAHLKRLRETADIQIWI